MRCKRLAFSKAPVQILLGRFLHVAAGGISPHRAKRWPGRRAALSRAFEAVRQQPWDKRDADRHLARTVTNGGMGIAWQATRLLIRAYRLYQRARIRFGLREDAPARPVETEPGLVLISHHILTQEDRSAVSAPISSSLCAPVRRHSAPPTRSARR